MEVHSADVVGRGNSGRIPQFGDPSLLCVTHRHCRRIASHRVKDGIMAIPLSYNIRNMVLRKGLTIMTALGIALTVTTAVFLMMLLAGLKKAFVTSGDPLNVLVMRKGSSSELVGGFSKDKLPILRQLPGIATDSHGQPLVSPEWVVIVALP